MCPTVLAGQNYDLQEAPETIVKEFIRDRWPVVKVGYIPAKDEISFSLFGWSGRKSYQISIEPYGAAILKELNIGRDQWTQYKDPMYIHVFMIKNYDEVPPQMHHMTQKAEQIVRENITNVGHGINAIRLVSPFSAVNTMTAYTGNFPNQIEVSLWYCRATVELLYYRVTYNTLSSVQKSKIHKYNIEIED